MSFPDTKFASIASYYESYAAELSRALATVDRAQLARAGEVLENAIGSGAQVFACGNGGSAAIANHLVCDHAKGIAADTGLRPRIQSLAACVEMITAIANDMAYDQVFAYQLELAARPGDVLITISSSGQSPSIVKAIEWAMAHGMRTIALNGFAGTNASARLADISLHVAAENYGIVEDVHQSLMHVLAQFIRQARMEPALIAQRKF